MSSEENNFPMQSSKETSYMQQVINVNDKLCSKILEQEYPQPLPVSSDMRSNTDPQCNKSKRSRTVFTSFQLFQLENIFKSHKYLCRKQRIIVALRLSLCEKQVKIWFQNRRMKCKKEQQSVEAKPTKNKTQTMTDQINHKGTVQRLMAYSRSPVIQKTTQTLTSSCFAETNTLSNHPSCRTDLKEILDLLEENSPSNSQNSASISSNVTYYCSYNTDIQAIKQDLELAAQAWSTNTIFCESQAAMKSSDVPQLYAVTNETAHQTHQLSQWTPIMPSATTIPSMNLTWGEPNPKTQHQL